MLNLCKKSFIIALLLSFALSVQAARVLPMDIKAGRIKHIDYTYIQFVRMDRSLVENLLDIFIRTDKPFPIAPGLRIFDLYNRTLLRGQLDSLGDQIVGVTFNQQGQVNRIWVLSEAEIAQLREREKQMKAAETK